MPSSGEVAGYFTISPLSIGLNTGVLERLGISTTAPYPVIGGYLLGRLGVSVTRQGGPLGRLLVAQSILTARSMRALGGGVFLAVDPRNEQLLAWYLRLEFGFQRLSQERRRLVLALRSS